MGAGRTELLESLSGLRPESTGEVLLDGRALEELSPAERIGRGLVLVPEDRQVSGVVQSLTVRDNMILASLSAYTKGPYLDSSKVEPKVAELVRDLSIKIATPSQPITSLSGGNQQKVVIAKCLLTAPRVLLLDEPTRGIDVGAKGEICDIMNRLAGQGLGVIFASSELEEVVGMADRILVLSKGQITAEFDREHATNAALAAAASANLEGIRDE
jgi:erythritol transport system ATP-binding protein